MRTLPHNLEVSLRPFQRPTKVVIPSVSGVVGFCQALLGSGDADWKSCFSWRLYIAPSGLHMASRVTITELACNKKPKQPCTFDTVYSEFLV